MYNVFENFNVLLTKDAASFKQPDSASFHIKIATFPNKNADSYPK